MGARPREGGRAPRKRRQPRAPPKASGRGRAYAHGHPRPWARAEATEEEGPPDTGYGEGEAAETAARCIVPMLQHALPKPVLRRKTNYKVNTKPSTTPTPPLPQSEAAHAQTNTQENTGRTTYPKQTGKNADPRHTDTDTTPPQQFCKAGRKPSST